MPRLSVLACFLATLCLTAAGGIYNPKSPVLEVTAKNYDSLIAQSNYTSIVEFYAPWCGHCQNLKPAYEKAAKSLTGLAKVAAVNCDEDSNKAFCGQFGVQGFPTLKIVRPGKKPGRPIVEDYQGPREAKPIVEAVTDKISNHVKRLKEETLDPWVDGGTNPKVILFTEKATTAPLIKALAIDFLGVIDFAQLRNTEKGAVEKYEVTEFPTIILVQDASVSKYDGEITKEALTKFLSQAAPPNLDPAPEKSKQKPSSTKKSKSASASSAFSKVSEKHKSSDFEDHMNHASTVIVDDNFPGESPLPIVESKQMPITVPDVPPPLETLQNMAELRSACLNPDSTNCVLVLLPQRASTEADFDGETSDALTGFAIIQAKYNKRKAAIFPAYAVPVENDAAAPIRKALDLKPRDQVDIVVLNIKKGWAKKYEKSSFGLKDLESFVDDIRLGEGTKQKLPKYFLTTADTNTEPISATQPAEVTSDDHDEL